jgi:hypothetical protein
VLTSRRYDKDNKEERDVLWSSLLTDEYHEETPIQFFEEPGTITNIYALNTKDILYARGKPVLYGDKPFLRLDIQFLNNRSKDNLKVMLEGFPLLEANAKSNDFAGVLFESNVPIMREFCKKRLGFEELLDAWLIKKFGVESEDIHQD